MKIKKFLTKALYSLCTTIVMGMASLPVMATESDKLVTGTTETGTISLTRSQLTKEQQNQYDQMLKNMRNGQDLKVGESRLLGIDSDGSELYVICTGSETISAKGSWKTSTKSYNINKTLLGVVTTIVVVDFDFYS